MYNRIICYLINSFLCLSYKKEFVDYMKIRNVRTLQQKSLTDILSKNKSCEYGKKYDFSKIGSIEEFQKKVPLTKYEDYMPYKIGRASCRERV